MAKNGGDSHSQGPAFSVVIPAYGPTPYLATLVRSLVEQTPPPDKVVIVHTGSDDPTDAIAPVVDNALMSVQIIHEDRRMLAGAARNRGVEEVETPWVAFLDCDVVPAPDFCANVVAAIAETEVAGLFGAIGTASTGGYWGRCLWYIEFGSVHPYLPRRLMDTGPGMNMVMRRDMFERVEGFPPKVPAGEDAFCQLKTREKAGRFLFVPDIRIGHHMVGGFSSFCRHLVPLGSAAARVRSAYDLVGSEATTTPLLAVGLWLARLGQIGYRVLRYGRGHRLQVLGLVPGLVVGLLIWNWGFMRYLLSGSSPILEPELDGKFIQAGADQKDEL